MVIEKRMSVYGKKVERYRIDMNASDGFKKGDKVIILSKNEYIDIKNEIFDLRMQLRECKAKLSIYDNMDSIIEETVRKTLEVEKW